MHPLYRITHVGRPIEPRYPTNRAILVLMGVALLGGAAHARLGGASIAATLGAGGLALLTVFFTWALGREAAPDDNPAAFIAVALAAAAWVGLGKPEVLLLACAVGLTRMCTRTVGEPPMVGDTLLLVVLPTALTLTLGMTAVGAGAALALALDGTLAAPRRIHLPLALVPLAAVVVHIARYGIVFAPPVPWWAIAAGAAAVVAIIATQPPMRSACDLNARPLERRRVQAGLLVVLFMSVWGTLVAGEIADVAPLWAVLVGVTLGRLGGR